MSSLECQNHNVCYPPQKMIHYKAYHLNFKSITGSLSLILSQENLLSQKGKTVASILNVKSITCKHVTPHQEKVTFLCSFFLECQKYNR